MPRGLEGLQMNVVHAGNGVQLSAFQNAAFILPFKKPWMIGTIFCTAPICMGGRSLSRAFYEHGQIGG